MYIEGFSSLCSQRILRYTPLEQAEKDFAEKVKALLTSDVYGKTVIHITVRVSGDEKMGEFLAANPDKAMFLGTWGNPLYGMAPRENWLWHNGLQAQAKGEPPDFRHSHFLKDTK